MPDGTDTMKTGRGIQPVVDNPELPPMSDEPPRPRPISGKILRMAEEPKPDTGKQKRMVRLPQGAASAQPKMHPEQKEANVTRAEAAQQPEGYVRLRLRVTEAARCPSSARRPSRARSWSRSSRARSRTR